MTRDGKSDKDGPVLRIHDRRTTERKIHRRAEKDSPM
jgi:hypothetical protein